MKGLRQILFFAALLFLIMPGSITAQEEVHKFFLIKAGAGLPYGAFGMNVEYRRNHIAGYIGGGYMKPLIYYEHLVPSSLNAGLGGKFYFFDPEAHWKPHAGLHFGWLNNYYRKEILTESYNPTVYGAAVCLGVELSENFLFLDIDFLIDPGIAVLNPSSHPYYSSQIYITPSIGLGINLYDIRKAMLKKRYRNKNHGVTPSDINDEMDEDEDPSLMVEDSLDIDRQTKKIYTQIITNRCKTNSTVPVKQIFRKDTSGSVTAGQQIGENTYLLIHIPASEISPDQNCRVLFVDTVNSRAEVFICQPSGVTDSLETIINRPKTDSNARDSYKAVQGKIVMYYDHRKKQYSLRLNNLKLERKISGSTEDIYYDEIFICNVCE